MQLKVPKLACKKADICATMFVIYITLFPCNVLLCPGLLGNRTMTCAMLHVGPVGYRLYTLLTRLTAAGIKDDFLQLVLHTGRLTWHPDGRV